MTERIMVDIETLGLEPGCVILSIGAVEFDTGGLGQTFYAGIDIETGQEAGLTIDANTLKWWLDQDETVRDVLFGGGVPLEEALRYFADFYDTNSEIWANSPSFDCELLEAAYTAVGIEIPWAFHEERCFRTLASLPQAPELEQEGDEHHALDDAEHQARVASETLARLERDSDG